MPQLAIRDTTGADYPAYFNIWQWIQPQLTAPERGGRKGSVKPEAILKYAHHPGAMLAGLWERELEGCSGNFASVCLRQSNARTA